MGIGTKIRQRAVVAAGAGVMALGVSAAVAAPASASAGGCSAGYVSATKAWGSCKTASRGWGGFRLTVQCYGWGANTAYGKAPNTIYSTCPGWSHITRIIIGPASF